MSILIGIGVAAGCVVAAFLADNRKATRTGTITHYEERRREWDGA